MTADEFRNAMDSDNAFQAAGDISGILGKRLDIYIGEYGVDTPKYKKTGIFKRNIGLPAKATHETYGEIYYTEYFDLNKYDQRWKRSDFRSLLLSELKFRAEAWITYRETLDLSFPYLLGLSSLLAFAIGLCRP